MDPLDRPPDQGETAFDAAIFGRQDPRKVCGEVESGQPHRSHEPRRAPEPKSLQAGASLQRPKAEPSSSSQVKGPPAMAPAEPKIMQPTPKPPPAKTGERSAARRSATPTSAAERRLEWQVHDLEEACH